MNATVSWHEEPDFRGTYSILASCLSTLFVSTWSALHLDIPESGKRGQSPVMRFLDKLGWLVLGLLAPEYLLLLAFNQFMAARDLTKYAREELNTPDEPPIWIVRLSRQIASGLGHLLWRKVSAYPIGRDAQLLTSGRQVRVLRPRRREGRGA